MPSNWGPSDEELINARSHRFSASLDSLHSEDQLGGKDDDDNDASEVEDDEGMDDHIGYLFDLAEAAHFHHSDEGIISLLEDITLHDGSTSNHSPRKRSHL